MNSYALNISTVMLLAGMCRKGKTDYAIEFILEKDSCQCN